MFLPLAHIFARLIQVGSVDVGAKMAFSTGTPQLLEELAMVKPTFVFSVPRVFEKVYNSAASKANEDGKGKIFDAAAKTAIDFARQSEHGSVGLKTKVMHAVFDKLVYSKIRALFGGRATTAVSGGAPLGERLGFFFSGVGHDRLRGLRPDRDVGRDHGGKDAASSRSVRSARRFPACPSGSPTTARCSSRVVTSSRATGTTTQPPPKPSASDGWFHSGRPRFARR